MSRWGGNKHVVLLQNGSSSALIRGKTAEEDARWHEGIIVPFVPQKSSEPFADMDKDPSLQGFFK